MLQIDPGVATVQIIIIAGLMQVTKGILVSYRVSDTWFPAISIGIGIVTQIVYVCGLQGFTHINGIYSIIYGVIYGGLACGIFDNLKPLYNLTLADNDNPSTKNKGG